MSDDDEDLFPHEEDDIDLSIDCYGWSTEDGKKHLWI